MKRRRWLKILLISTAALLVLAAAGAGGAYFRLTRTGLPVVTGEIKTGVLGRVEIYRDEYGVPHIIASHADDLFFAQGYVQAQDRLWQMDMSRRGVSGRLSEILGEGLLKTDRFTLTIGFRRAAEESLPLLNAETRRLLEAYSRGVNAFIEQNRNRLSMEFKLIGYEPEPWAPVDSLAIAKYMAWILSGNMDTELFLSALIAHVGEEAAAELFPYYPGDGPVIVERAGGPVFTPADVPALLELSRLGELGGRAGYVPGLGSNNWVVSGVASASGNALLAGDMHLGMGVPSIWYLQHLILDGAFNVTGVMFPGVPGIIVGFNEYIAWGVTNVGPDVQDLYKIRFDESAPNSYEYMGELREATILHLEIPVKNSDPEILEVVITCHGPVISNVVDLEQPLSLRWTALKPTREADMLLEIAYARNWEEFCRALEYFMVPAQNFVYADRYGNIGFRANGLFPIRKRGDGLLPVPGWTDEYEWEGFVPWGEIPQLYNPPAGFIVTANHRVIDDDYPYLISHEWAPPYRARGILRELEGRVGLTLEDMKRIQGSFYNTQAELLLPVIMTALENRNLDKTEAKGLELLRAWAIKPVDEADLAAPLIYHYLYLKIIENTFRDELGADLYERLLRYRSLINLMDRKLLTGESGWFNNIRTPEEECRDEIIALSFRQTMSELGEKLALPPDQWRWGELHTITFRHNMAEREILARIFNRGPFPVGGSAVTPANMSFSARHPFAVTHSAPWRFVVEVREQTGFDSLAIGNSGHPFSPHYDDQLQLWLDRAYKPMPFTTKAVRELDNLLVILPR